MRKRKDGLTHGKYSLEFSLGAVRLVESGPSVPATGKILSVPSQTLGNCARLSEKGRLLGAGAKPVSAEQMALARLRAGVVRLKMAGDILAKATACFTWQSFGSTPG